MAKHIKETEVDQSKAKDFKWSKLMEGSAEYKAMIAQWQKNHDCVMGQDQIKSKGKTYLPPTGTVMKQEEGSGIYGAFNGGSKYKIYLHDAPYINYTKGSLHSFKGSLFRKEVSIENIKGTSIEKFIDDIDMNGTSVQEACMKTASEDITTGMAGVMIMYPEESLSGARSYPEPIQAHQVLSYHKSLIGGKMKYDFVKLRLTETELDKDKTGYVNFDVVWLLTLDAGKFRITKFRQKKGVDEKSEEVYVMYDDYPMSNKSPIDYIPFRLTGDGKESMIGDIADINIHHYNSYAKLKRINSRKSAPITFGTIGSDGKMSEASVKKLEGAMQTGLEDVNLVLPGGSEIKIVEYKGEGAELLRTDVKDHEEQIGRLGAFHLSDNVGGVESNATLLTKNAGQMSGLNMTAHSVGEVWTWVLNELNKHWNIGGKVRESDIIVKINRDYLPINLDSAVLKELGVLAMNGQGSRRDIYALLKRTDNLHEGVETYEEWEASIEEGFVSAGGIPEDDEKDSPEEAPKKDDKKPK